MSDVNYWFIGKIKIKKEADVISVVAFLVSLSVAILQIKSAVEGVDVSLMDPENIAIFENDCGFGKNHMQVIIPLGFINTGGAGYNGVVSDVTLSLHTNQRKLKFSAFQVARYYVSTANLNRNNFRTCSSDSFTRGKFEYNSENSATIFNIESGSAKVKSVHFIPTVLHTKEGHLRREQKNIVTVNEFLSFMKDQQQLRIDIIAESNTRLKRTCWIGFSERYNVKGLLKEKGWIAPPISRCSDSVRSSQRTRRAQSGL